MPRLKDRQRQIPGGLMFELPALGWRSAPFSSFDTIVDQAVRLIRSNPKVAQENDWPSDRIRVADWVDQENALRCERNSWLDYYLPGGNNVIPSSAVPYEGWPLWAKTMATLKQVPPDAGVGDTVERVIGSDNSAALKAWYQKTFKRVCGCDGRKSEWNLKYRYV